MKTILGITILTIMVSSSVLAGGFSDRYEMMNSRIHSKMDKLKNNVAAQDFLNKKLDCIKASKVEGDLKVCKKKYHPKALKKLIK